MHECRKTNLAVRIDSLEPVSELISVSHVYQTWHEVNLYPSFAELFEHDRYLPAIGRRSVKDIDHLRL